MKKRLISMFLVLALVLMTAVAVAASTAASDCSHPRDRSQDLGETDVYYVNYGGFHIKYSVHTWHCFVCRNSYLVTTQKGGEPHTLPCSLCGGITMEVEQPEETA